MMLVGLLTVLKAWSNHQPLRNVSVCSSTFMLVELANLFLGISRNYSPACEGYNSSEQKEGEKKHLPHHTRSEILPALFHVAEPFSVGLTVTDGELLYFCRGHELHCLLTFWSSHPLGMCLSSCWALLALLHHAVSPFTSPNPRCRRRFWFFVCDFLEQFRLY